MSRKRSTRVGYPQSAVAAVILGLAALRSAPAAAQPQLPPHGFDVGEAFPTHRLPDVLDGKVRSVQELRGTKAIVHVFASW